MKALYAQVVGFLKEPFKTPMDLVSYAALVLLTIILVIFWLFILAEVTRGIKKEL